MKFIDDESLLKDVPQTSDQEMEIIPPQYKGLNSEVLEEIWTVPEYVDSEKTKAEKERKEKALEYLRQQELDAATSQGELQHMTDEQVSIDAENISEVRKKLGLEREPAEELPNVRICRQQLEKRMLGQSENKADAYSQAITEMITTRSEFAAMREEVGGDLIALSKKFGKEMQEYKGELLPQLGAEVQAQGLAWESNPGWMGVNTRPEAGKREGINYKAYFTVPVNEYTFVKHIPTLSERLRKLAVDTDDIVQVKVPNGFMGLSAHNDSIVVHCKKQENAEVASEIVRSWMQEFGISEGPRELGRTQIAADGKSESFTQLVSKNVGQWLADNEGKYDQDILINKAIEYAIEYSQKPPNFSQK